MARNFYTSRFGNTSYLPVTSTPLTMSAWFKPWGVIGTDGSNSVMAINDGSVNINCWWLTTQIRQTYLTCEAPAACLWNSIAIGLIPSGTIAYTGAAAGSYGQTVAVVSIGYNVTGNYTLACVFTAEASDLVTSVTLAGIQMTLLRKNFATSMGWMYVYGLANPPVGVQTLAAYASQAVNFFSLMATSYSGAATIQPDSAAATAPASSATSTGAGILPSVNGAWCVTFHRNTNGAATATTNGNLRAYQQAGGCATIIDYGPMPSSSFYAYIGNGVTETGSTRDQIQMGKWNHGLGLFVNDTYRICYLNGLVGNDNPSASIIPTNSKYLTIAGFNLDGAGSRWFYGDLAELSLWNVALNQDEIFALAKGFSPLMIRPANLRGYYPFLGNSIPEPDLTGRTQIGLVGSPPKSEHFRIYQRRNYHTFNPPLLIATPLSPIVTKITMGNVAPLGRASLGPITVKVTLSSAIEPKVTVQKLIACIAPESWENHFLSRVWSSPQDQIDDFYPRYCQPTALTGMYEEVVDFGGTFANVIVNLNWAFNTIAGNVSIAPSIAVSSDGINFTPLVGGSSQFAQSIRYVKVHFDFVSADDKSLAEFFNLQVLLDVKNELDGGEGDALAADLNGTVVNFNKTFKNVKSITVSAKSAVDISAAYDFTSTPNPTGFKVFLFNASGNRVDGHFSWKARGVI